MAIPDAMLQVRSSSNGNGNKTTPMEPPARRPPEERVVTARKQLTLRCGKSSITLTAAGKIIIRGKYIVSRSSGVHRIKGGSVQIN